MITKDNLWAKLEPFESVESHLLRTGLVCKVACTRTSLKSVLKVLIDNCDGISEENLLNLICYIVAMHDIGKVHPSFQEKDKNFAKLLKEDNLDNPIRDGFRHEAQSYDYMHDILEGRGFNFDWNVLESFCCVLANHHYKKGDSYDITIKENIWKSFVYSIENSIFDIFSFFVDKNFKILNADVFYYYLFGLLIICDWIASGDLMREVDLSFDSDAINEKIYDTLLYLGFGEYNVNWKDIDYNYLLDGNILRPLQIWTKSNNNYLNSNLIIIEAGTGFGKTSLALYSAFQYLDSLDGFYYALPMQSMVNNKYMELKKICDYKGIPLTLLHSNRDLLDGIENIDFYEKENGDVIDVSNYLFSSNRRGLFNKYIVGTIDQLLSSILPNKFSVLKLIGLAGKVLILDEMHMCDSYMTGLLEKLLSWCKPLNIHVIILSATLSRELKERYISAYSGKKLKLQENNYPLLTFLDNDRVDEIFVEDNSKNKLLKLKLEDNLNDINLQAKSIIEIYNNENNIIVYKNTVSEAQKLYLECKKLGGENIILIHSRFTLKDRQEKEKLILKLFGKDLSNRPNKFIVISTQVLEASLDLDFDVCFSDLCPFDVLAQRVGRQCRFDINKYSNNRFELYVFYDSSYDFCVSEFVYPKIYLLNTLEFLKDKEVLDLPNMLRDGIENIFVLNDEIENSYLYYSENKSIEKLKTDRAKISSLNIPNIKKFSMLNSDTLFQDEEKSYFSTRLGDSVQILCLDNQSKLLDYDNVSFYDYKNLMKFSFSLPFKYLSNNIDNILYIQKGYLKDKYLLFLNDGSLDISDEKCYTYNSEIGFNINDI